MQPSPSLPTRPRPSHSSRNNADWSSNPLPPLPSSPRASTRSRRDAIDSNFAQEVIVPSALSGHLSKPFALASPPNAALRSDGVAAWGENEDASARGWCPGPSSIASSIPMSASSSSTSSASTSSESPFPSSPASPSPSPSRYFWSRSPFASPVTASALPLTPPTTPPSSFLFNGADDFTPLSERWDSSGFSVKLLFTQPGGRQSNTYEDHTLPPAFFPSTKISFTPRLRITSPAGLPYASLGGMHLGVTGMLETLDAKGNVRSKRMFVDFCTDMSSGLDVWKRDGRTAARLLVGIEEGEWSREAEDERLCLAAGTYSLPLSMKVPSSDRLPPSFESSRFRISYTMSLAIFSSQKNQAGTPLHVKVFSTPFHILPSTLPSPPPHLPPLTHEYKKSLMSNLINALSFSTPKSEIGYHCVYPSLPTSHFSPTSHASIPVSLKIVDRPLEPTDLYFRVALTRKIYVRESSHTSLAHALEDEWGVALGMAPDSLSEEVMCEPFVKEETEIVSRWGWVPYSSRPGADPMEKSEVLIRDITLPLENWAHGYSASLDIEPSEIPKQVHGECSWFSSAFRERPPVSKEYGKYIHISSRFFLTVEVGFATPALGETLEAIGNASPDMEIPLPNHFTAPQRPSASRYSGASLTDPFTCIRPPPSASTPPSSSSSPLPPLNPLPFPGKLRHICIPVTIGSVAEPTMECIAGQFESTPSRRAEREMREERGEDLRGEGEGPEGAWMCAPPGYSEAIKGAPAYVWNA